MCLQPPYVKRGCPLPFSVLEKVYHVLSLKLINSQTSNRFTGRVLTRLHFSTQPNMRVLLACAIVALLLGVCCGEPDVSYYSSFSNGNGRNGHGRNIGRHGGNVGTGGGYGGNGGNRGYGGGYRSNGGNNGHNGGNRGYGSPSSGWRF
ncbi:glycine-rich RNA-binding protein GRP1A-like [Portunus trituberculatus]|uniref:glycine-rich RNA-binding protein GRP1A-like n=1 Tax=Portunus trituberculatus TaxID=210409 RepID=UPI001E1D074C|nr:glycine-rich RNA-binding protein GRP1A-like [Portunus trituberculatus]